MIALIPLTATEILLTCIIGLVTWKVVHQILFLWRIWPVTRQIQPFGPFHYIWGHLHLFSDTISHTQHARKLIEKTRTKIYCTWFTFMLPTFNVVHPDTVRLLLKSSEPKPTLSVGSPYRTIMKWIGDGLLLSSGKKWERNRRLLTPAFHFDILKPYVTVYNQVADVFLKQLEDKSKDGRSVEIYNHVCLATLDTMLRCAFSFDEDIQNKGGDHPYVKAVRRLSELIMSRLFSPWIHRDFIYNLTPQGREYNRLTSYVHHYADKIIQARRKAIEEDPSQLNKRRLDFLDILITAKDENRRGLSDLEIRAEVDTFLFEGHDTTASAISWAIYCLGKYPDMQEKIYLEVNDATGNQQYIEWEDLNKLKYMTSFVKEMMRMYPPVPVISRWLTKPMVIDGVTIPENFPVDMMLHQMNRHPDVWTNPNEFIPERFSEGNQNDRDPYSYVPFSAGSRNCIGQHFAMNEIKVTIGRIVKRFRVSLDPDHEYVPMPELVLRSKYGIKVFLKDR